MTALTHVEIHEMSSLCSRHSTSPAPEFVATTYNLNLKIKISSKGILHTFMSALNRKHTQILAGVFAEVHKTSNKAVSSGHISIALSPYIAVSNVRYNC